MVKAVIFDCFGVLVRDWLAALMEPYDDEAKALAWDAIKASNSGYITHVDGNKQVADALNIGVEELLASKEQNETRNVALLEFIAELRKQGYKTAVLSNVSAGGITRRFTQKELNEWFDAVVESGSIGITKPDKDAYLYTATQLGVSPYECIMVDDREDFCAGAELAGMSSILYTDMAQFKDQLTQMLANSN